MDKSWENPLDPEFSRVKGGRWNPPDSFASLYLNENIDTAQGNLRNFIAHHPYEPEDLRTDNGPVLVGATLPSRQKVCDAHTAAGVRALGLPKTYPLNAAGKVVSHKRCQPLGRCVKQTGLRGVHCRSAQAPAASHATGRELAWFPATPRSRAQHVCTQGLSDWYWGDPMTGAVQQKPRAGKQPF